MTNRYGKEYLSKTGYEMQKLLDKAREEATYWQGRHEQERERNEAAQELLDALRRFLDTS